MPRSTAARMASSESASLTPDQPICFPPISAGPPIDHAPNVSGETINPVLPNGRLSSIGQLRHFHVGDSEHRFRTDRAEAELSASWDFTRQFFRIGELRSPLPVDLDEAMRPALGDLHVILLVRLLAQILAGDHQVEPRIPPP